MTNFDDRVRNGLNNAGTRPPRPISDLQARARAIHNRRRAATAGAVLVAAVAVALPFAVTGTGSVAEDTASPAATASTDSSPDKEPDAEKTVSCETWSGETRGRNLTLEEVPDHLRLVWDTRLAASPTSARAIDWREAAETVRDRSPAGCVIPDEGETELEALILVQADDDEITNNITIYGPAELDPEHFQQAEHHTVPTQVGPMHIASDRDLAFWPAGENQYWAVSHERSMTDMELIELAETVRIQDGRIDVSQWSGYDSVVSASSPLEGPGLGGIEVTIEGPIDVRLASERSRRELWHRAHVDDEVVDINGQPGILSPTRGHLDFLIDDSVLVQVRSHGLTTDELLTIARSIEPVPADDPRLAEVWQTEFDEPTP